MITRDAIATTASRNSSSNDNEAEMSLLGCLLLNPASIDDVGTLSPCDFYLEKHRYIFRAMKDTWDDGGNLDTLLLCDALKQRQQFESIGGAAYIGTLCSSVLTPDHVANYAEIIVEHSRKRLIAEIATDALQLVESRAVTSAEISRRIGDRLSVASIVANSIGVTLADALNDSIDLAIKSNAGEDLTSVSFGFNGLDDLTAGLHPNELSILATRPSMGKTALALNIAENVARSGVSVLFASLEMSRRELADRLLCSHAKVNTLNLRRGDLTLEDQDALHGAFENLKALPIQLLDSTQLTVADIASHARRILRSGDLGLIVIDYLQLLEPDEPEKPRHEQVAKIARRLKQLARQLQVPILCLSQLNRISADGKNHQPQLSHLRESGSIEQDADVVMFVHRESYYLEGDAREKKLNKANLIVAKQRNGPIGDVELVWDANTGRFSDPVPERFSAFDEFNESRYRDGF